MVFGFFKIYTCVRYYLSEVSTITDFHPSGFGRGCKSPQSCPFPGFQGHINSSPTDFTKLLCFCLFPHGHRETRAVVDPKKGKQEFIKVAHGSPPSGRSRKIDCSKVQRSLLADLKTEWQWWPRQCAFCTRSKPICPEEYLQDTKGVGRCRMLGTKPNLGASLTGF